MKDKMNQKKKCRTEERKKKLTFWIGQAQSNLEQSLLGKELGQRRESMTEDLLQHLLLDV